MIWSRIKELRESTGMSARKFSEEIGIKYTTYYGYETGSREPGSDFIVKFAAYFGVTTDYILGLEKEKSPDSALLPNAEDTHDVFNWLLELLHKSGYKNPKEDLTKKEADFLIHLIGLLDSFFDQE